MIDPTTIPEQLTPRTLFDVLCRVLGVLFCVDAAVNFASAPFQGLWFLPHTLAGAAAGAFLILRADLVQRWSWRTWRAKPPAGE